MHDSINNLVEQIRSKGLRVTEPRLQLLELLLNTNKALSVEDILQELSNQGYDTVTLYRNLDVFDKAGILLRIKNEEGRERFRINEPNVHMHVIVCRKCHHTEEIDQCLAHEFESIAQEKGFTNISHILELYGLCKRCQ